VDIIFPVFYLSGVFLSKGDNFLQSGTSTVALAVIFAVGIDLLHMRLLME